MDKKIRTFLGLISPPSPPAQGVFHYLLGNQIEKTRVHLRVDPDGTGTLLVNAKYVYHLNPTATFIAYLFLEKIPEYLAIKGLTQSYNIGQKQALTDYQNFSTQVSKMISPNGHCPICDLNLEIITPFSTKPSAPYRMDLALSYLCNNACSHCYNDRSRQIDQIGPHQWKKILDILWDLGIPHIIFTGGEPTLYPDLPDLINHAETKGQITGINTNGRRLKDRDFLSKLIEVGLDHVQITLESHDPQIHDQMVGRKGAFQETVAGIKNTVNSDLYLMTNTTMLKPNITYMEKTLNFLYELGVMTVGLNALIYSGGGLEVDSGIKESDLPDILNRAQEITNNNGQRLIWYTPTQYCHFDPVQMELGVKGCTAALFNMCIEPDGSVIPCQSYYEPLGNIMVEDWQSIWHHELAISLRERKQVPDECKMCSIFSICGGGCPLARQAGKIASPVPQSTLNLEMENV